MSRRMLIVPAAIALAFAAAAEANAGVVLFSDLGPGGSVYQAGSGAIVQGLGSNITNARSFSVSGSGQFNVTQIDLAMVEDQKSANTFFLNTFTASIWTDNGGIPGTQLGSWNLSTSVPNGTCCGLTTRNGITGVTLTGGDTYFMAAGPVTPSDGSKVEWENNTQGATTLEVGSLNGGVSWIKGGSVTNAAFDVLGVAPPPPSVPEPASLILLGGGLAAVFAARKSRKTAQ